MNSYELRREARIQRLLDRAAAARRAAASEYGRAKQMADVIPFGQPILVGHHSEKRDRACRARIENTFRRSFEALENAAYYDARAEAAENNRAISSDDPDATAKLRQKLAALEAEQARLKAINAAHKRFLKDPATLEGAELAEQDKERVRHYQPQYTCEPHPVAPFELSNLSANIRRVRERIEQIERDAARPEAAPIKGAGFTIEEDREDNRLLVRFDSRPSKEICQTMRQSGFKWSPTRGAWCRQLNTSRGYGEQIAKILAARIG